MKILIVAVYFPPLNRSGSIRPYYWAHYLSKMGHEVVVFTPQKSGADGSLNLELKEEGFRVLETGSPSKRVSEGKTGQYRAVIRRLRMFTGPLLDFYLIWSITALKDATELMDRERFDACISTFPPYAPHFICHQLKRRFPSLKWVADFRDISVGTHLFKTRGPFKFLEALFEENLYRNTDALTLVSDEWYEYFSRRLRKRIFVIENGFEPEEFHKVECNRPENRINLTYTGSLYPGIRDPYPLFEALRVLRAQGVDIGKFSINFYGESDYALVLAQKYGLTDIVRYHGMVSRQDAIRAQISSSVLLFFETEEKNVFGIATGKIYEYLYACYKCRIPILGIGITSSSPAGKLIVESGCGQAVGNDISKIAEFINRLGKVNPRDDFILQFTRENGARKLHRILTQI